MAKTFKTRDLGAIVELRLDIRMENYLASFGLPSGEEPIASELLVRERIPVEVAGEATTVENERKQLELRLRMNLDPIRDIVSRIEVAVVDAIEAERARTEETP